MISGWLLRKRENRFELYRLEPGRAPFLIDTFSQYKGPGTARPPQWGPGKPTGGHRTLAWILAMHSTEDSIIATYLTFPLSAYLCELRADSEYFLSDEHVGEICYAILENLYGNVEIG